MRLSRPVILAGLSLLVLGGLAGCRNNAHQSSASFEDSSSASSKYSAPKPETSVTASSHSKIAQTYRPKAAQTKRKGYVKSGKLTKRGQYTYDKVGTQLTLDAVHPSSQTIKSGALTYQLTTVRIIRNVAETANAKKMAAQALNLASIKSPYYTLQVKFTIKNNGTKAVTTDGIKAIQLSSGHTLNATNQLSDASAGKTIPAHQSLATFATGLASQTTAPKLTHIKIAFAGGFGASQNQLVKPTGWLTVPLTA